MSEMCTDNRFELIEKYKAKLIEATNIEDAHDEMAVIDNILFRFWQMGWLDMLEKPELDDMKDLPSAQQWIPCSERLPDKANFYICTMKDSLVKSVWYSTFHGFEWEEDVIAWMSLPEPWKGENDG